MIPTYKSVKMEFVEKIVKKFDTVRVISNTQ